MGEKGRGVQVPVSKVNWQKPDEECCIFSQDVKVEMVTSVLAPDFAIDYEPYMSVRLFFPPGASSLTVEFFKNGQQVDGPRVMGFGDSLTLKHEISLHQSEPVLFPKRITYKGQVYYLNRTKAGKLILTK